MNEYVLVAVFMVTMALLGASENLADAYRGAHSCEADE